MCMIESLDEPYQVWHRVERRARKPHQCAECDRVIDPGERYEFTTGLLDGYWDHFHTCAHCLAARVWLERVCHGFLYHAVLEDLEEHWTEHWRPIKTTYLGRLIVLMRRDWTYRGARVPVSQVQAWAERGAALATSATAA